jgi:hypothetical protein
MATNILKSSALLVAPDVDEELSQEVAILAQAII